MTTKKEVKRLQDIRDIIFKIDNKFESFIEAIRGNDVNEAIGDYKRIKELLVLLERLTWEN